MKRSLARLISNIINPFLLSSIVMVLIAFESTSSARDALKWLSLSIALSVLPVLVAIVLLVRCRQLEGIFINPRQQRHKVYLLSLFWGAIAGIILHFLGAPNLLVATFVAGLTAMSIFMLVNLIWKISLHTAFTASSAAIMMIVYGAAGIWALLLVFPVAWARIELKYHTPAQVTAGALLSIAIVVSVYSLFGIVVTPAI